jgi:hypothetical protein
MNLFRRLLLFAGAAAVLGLMVPSVLAASQYLSTIQEDEYWELVQLSQDTLSASAEDSNSELKENLKDLADQWEAVGAVEVDGQVIPLDHSYLIKLLREKEPDLKIIDGLLAAMQEEHNNGIRGSFSTSDLNSLHGILAQPEFTWQQPASNPLNDWFQKIINAINDLINDLLSRIFGAKPLAGSTGTFTWAIVASLVLIAVFIFVYRTLFNDFIRETELNEGDETSEPFTSESAFDRAQSLSRGGDYRSAVRYLYLSSLLLMDERGILRYDRSRTNHEYLRSVANIPELAKPLGEVIEVFDYVWYGYHSLEEESFKKYSDRVEELKGKKS